MQNPRKPSPRRSAAEWRSLISRWERSGESADTFAKRHRVATQSLKWWRWKIGTAPKPRARATDFSFMPVVAATPPAETRWVVETAAGLRVEMSGASALVVDALDAALSRLREEA